MLSYVHSSHICDNQKLVTMQMPHNRRMDTKNAEYCSAIKDRDTMIFVGKWLELENIILSEATLTEENTYSMYSLISGY